MRPLPGQKQSGATHTVAVPVQVSVQSVDSRGMCMVVDAHGHIYPTISQTAMLGSGAYPQPGEDWMIQRVNGDWTFTARVIPKPPAIASIDDIVAALIKLGFATPDSSVPAAAGSPVTSVFGRTGAVVAANGDYTAAEVTNAADLSKTATQNFSGVVTATGLQGAGGVWSGVTGWWGLFAGAVNGGTAPSYTGASPGDFATDPTSQNIWLYTGSAWVRVADVVQTQIWGMMGTATISGTSTAWANLTPFGTLSFTKRMAGTKLTFVGTTSAWVTTASVGYNFGMLFNGADHLLGTYSINAPSDHRTVGLAASVAGVPAGTYTLQPRYFVNTGTVNVDVNDSLRLEIKETW